MIGTKKPQATVPSRPRPRPPKQHGSGFESHPTAAVGRRPLPTRQAAPGSGLTQRSTWYPMLPGATYVALIGRATTVPFTTDTSGGMRTPTDNPMAATTCAVRRLAR
jgi:hypothetical protein